GANVQEQPEIADCLTVELVNILARISCFGNQAKPLAGVGISDSGDQANQSFVVTETEYLTNRIGTQCPVFFRLIAIERQLIEQSKCVPQASRGVTGDEEQCLILSDDIFHLRDVAQVLDGAFNRK